MKRILLCVLACSFAHPAYAYRPFNSTDAAVAKGGELELECGPLGYVIDADGRFLVVPSAILNFGLTDDWELVIEGRNFLLVPPDSAGRRDTLRQTILAARNSAARPEHATSFLGPQSSALAPQATPQRHTHCGRGERLS